MKDINIIPYHAMSEKIVQILCQRTNNSDPHFFRILTAYHLAKVASMMHVKVHSKAQRIIPINVYAINLATSGHGKGHSTSIFEDEILNGFRNVFENETFPVITEENLARLATKRANIKGEDPDVELEAVRNEFNAMGPLLFAFDSGTTPALKQAHHKILMGKIGSMNFEMDEIGSNLTGNADILTTMLELFDVGKVKQKLTKNTKDNQRNSDLEGRAPANLIMFGTPAKLLDGSRTEDEFWSFLDTGYARRCLFGYTRTSHKNTSMTPEQVYDALTDASQNAYLAQVSAEIGQLAAPVNYNKVIIMDKDVSLILLEYKLHCERQAESLGETTQDMVKAELSHRYFKALKLAGLYAFLDRNSEVTEDELYSAIKLVEESGKAFTRLVKRDRNYVKLAKYIANVGMELTQADLTEDLPFFKGTIASRTDMLQLAIAWGYKNRVIIKKSVSNGIEFISGETLQKTDLNNMILSLSDDITINYQNMSVPFDKLYRLATKSNLHWVAHHLKDGYRSDDNIIPGFNMVVLDIDGGTSLEEVRSLLKDYTCFIYTTKRHTAASNRFRLIIPTNYFLKLDTEDYKEFMQNIFAWLPFDVDDQTIDRPRKWLTNNGSYEYIQGNQLLDVMEFIPKTTRNDERKKLVLDTQSLTNIERWFITNTINGNRSNQLVRYALMLVDTGNDYVNTRNAVINLNNKLPDKLSEREIDSTIMVTVSKAIKNKQP